MTMMVIITVIPVLIPSVKNNGAVNLQYVNMYTLSVHVS